jgi:hypothetical protein
VAAVRASQTEKTREAGEEPKHVMWGKGVLPEDACQVRDGKDDKRADEHVIVLVV